MSLLGNQHSDFEKQLKKQLSDTEYKPSESLWERIDQDVNRPEFEQKVASKLHQYQVTPSQETWEQIEAQLPPEPHQWKPLGKFWYGLLLLLFGSGLTIGYFITKHQQAHLAEYKLAVKQQNKPGIAITPNNKEVEQTTRKIATPKLAAKNGDVTLQPITALKKLPLNSTSQQPKQQVVSLNTQRKHLMQHRPKATVVADVLKQPVPVKTIAQQATNIQLSSDLLNNGNQVNAEQPKQQRVVTTAMESQPLPIEQAKNLAATDSLKEKPAPTLVSANPIGTIMPAIPDSATKVSSEKIATNTPSRFSISIIAGAHKSNMQLTGPDNKDMSSNINLRKQVERPKTEITAGFLVNYSLSKHWTISSGVFITNFKMEMTYNTTPTSLSSQKEPNARYIHPNDSIYGGSGEYRQRISYSWNEIPLLVTFNINPEKRLSYELKSGLSYAIINTVDANMISYNNVGVLVLKGKESFPQIGNSVFAHVYAGVTYRINEGVALTATPYIRYSLNSMVKNDNWVQQRPYLTGISLSLRKYF